MKQIIYLSNIIILCLNQLFQILAKKTLGGSPILKVKPYTWNGNTVTIKISVAPFIIFILFLFGCSNSTNKTSNAKDNTQIDSVSSKTPPVNYAIPDSIYLPDSISTFLFSGVEKAMKTLRSMKPGDTAFVDYAECLLKVGDEIKPATFCIKAPEPKLGGLATKDPQFSWNITGQSGWGHTDNLTYQTATQGIWETDCHAKMARNGSQEYYILWLENGTPGNAHHKDATPKFKDKDGNVWMIGQDVSYIINSGKHLSTMRLIKTTLP